MKNVKTIAIYLFTLVMIVRIISFAGCDNVGNADPISSPTDVVTESPDVEPTPSNTTELKIKGDLDKLPEGKEAELRQVFDSQFPLIWEKFGRGDMPSKIVYNIDAAYDDEGGIAYTSGRTVVLNPYWLKRNPNDIDCMTHELIHVAQSYKTYDNSWLVEGIADYGRNMFGVNNAKAGWSLPRKYNGGSLKDGYNTTAAFLVWVEKTYAPDMVDVLNELLKENKYKESIWEEKTQKSIDNLWNEYTKS